MLRELNEYPSRFEMKSRLQITTLTLSQRKGEMSSVNFVTKENILPKSKKKIM